MEVFRQWPMLPGGAKGLSQVSHIVKPLTNVSNQSLQTGIFASKMKTAKVIPIYKSGSQHLFSNYRPVSLLSQFSRILEKLFVQRFD